MPSQPIGDQPPRPPGIKALKLQGTDKRVVTLREVLFGAWDPAKLSHQKLPKQLPKAGGAGVNDPISMNLRECFGVCVYEFI